MKFGEIVSRPVRTLLMVAAVALILVLHPFSGSAQTCTDCELYAATELNLRQEPTLEAEVLRFIPAGAAVRRTADEDVDGYAPVVYDGVPGWAISLGLVATPEEVDAVGGATAAPVAPAEPAADSGDSRFTLTPLVLRSEPSAESEPILVMPEGATVTLTREGAQDGYVTVDYDGTRGWAYADLLGGD